MFLTTAAYVYLANYADDRARSLIGTLMLFTGLAGSVFWPVTALLDRAFGWRGAVLVYAGTMFLLVCPLVLLGLPEAGRSTEPETTGEKPAPKGLTFGLLVLVIALNSFVTFGIEAIGIELFRTMGADLAGAVAIASLLGQLRTVPSLFKAPINRNHCNQSELMRAFGF
ncbi:hypothetical protein [Chelativorans salis]|uniref:Major facilitator superfamily (MFS) profile domain-containing protein n=1 Tax=Chelativorans salis TaxID=2978478 RepID=A0ABT2LRU5_9HYPH|nr:hypothetical protein [Chelativorans sp. EGI FJ00035]MCT7376814.1 hypothetical protein [Chelativorans sp. EGI FJ00035]